MPESYTVAMRAHRKVHGRTQHSYDLPAIAWRQILDAMIAQCYGPAGGKLKDAGRPPDSALLAIKRVAEAVKRIEGHPALRNATVEGWLPDVIPAWTDYLDSRSSPYPRAYAIDRKLWPFVLLTPQFGENLGMRVTRWEYAPRWVSEALEHEGESSWTFQESTHLSFLDPVAV
jgi:hypothetical protein